MNNYFKKMGSKGLTTIAGGLGIAGTGAYIGGKVVTNKFTTGMLKGLYPGNLTPSGSGRYGYRTNPGQDASGIAGMKFSYRRK